MPHTVDAWQLAATRSSNFVCKAEAPLEGRCGHYSARTTKSIMCLRTYVGSCVLDAMRQPQNIIAWTV